jgi:hypothetical protein
VSIHRPPPNGGLEKPRGRGGRFFILLLLLLLRLLLLLIILVVILVLLIALALGVDELPQRHGWLPVYVRL